MEKIGGPSARRMVSSGRRLSNARAPGSRSGLLSCSATRSTRQRAGGSLPGPGQVELLDEGLTPPGGLLAGEAVQAAVVDELLADARLGRRAAPLGDIADLASHLHRLGAEVVAGDGRRSGARLEQGGEHAERGRLVGAVGPEEADDLAGGDVEVDATHGVDRALSGVEALGQAPRLNHVVKLEHDGDGEARWARELVERLRAGAYWFEGEPNPPWSRAAGGERGEAGGRSEAGGGSEPGGAGARRPSPSDGA